MLRNEYLQAVDSEVMEFLMHREPINNTTWLHHCLRNDWTVAEMMSGFDHWKRNRVEIDHREGSLIIEANTLPPPA